MRKTLLAALAVAVLLGTSAPQPAQAQPKPVVKLSVASFDTVLDDVDFFAELAGQRGMRAMAEMTIQMFSGGKGLNVIDKTKPWGVIGVMGPEQSEPKAYGFIPVRDLGTLVEVLGQFSQQNQEVRSIRDKLRELDEEAGTNPKSTVALSIGPMGQTVHLKYDKTGGWLYLADNAEVLALTPKDPAALLGDLDDRYDVGLSFEVANLPQKMREMFVREMKSGAEVALKQAPGESPEEFAVRREVTERMVGEIARMIDELQAATIGLGVDRQASKVFLEIAVTAKEGSSLAGEMADMKDEKTDFAGFLMPEAAVRAHLVGKFAKEDIESLTQLLDALETRGLERIDDEGLSDDEKQFVKQLLTDLTGVAKATIEKGRLDGGLVVLLDEKTFTFAAGGAIADGKKLEELARKLTKVAREEAPEVAKAITLDVAEHNGVHFHRISIDADELKQEAIVKRVGDQFDVIVGFSDSAFYVAGGRDPIETLKKIIDTSAAKPGTKVPPMQLTVAATPIVELLAEMAPEPDRETLEAVAKGLQAAGDKDHLIVLVRPIERGVALRLEVEGGLIKAIVPWMQKLVEGMGVGMPGLGGGATPF